MSKSVRANLQLATEKDIRAICTKDAPGVSSKPDDYVKGNLLGYYIIVNTWLMIIQQWSAVGWAYVLDFMRVNGLFALIREFDAAAYQLIDGSSLSFGLARTLWSDVQSAALHMGRQMDSGKSFFKDPKSAMLLILRYGKRFSPVGADKLSQQSIDGFIHRQGDLRMWQRQPASTFVLNRVRDCIDHLLDWDGLCSELERVSLQDIRFTPGVSFDTKADLASKLRFVARRRVEYFPTPFGISCVANRATDEDLPQYWGKYNEYEKHTVRLVAVPKNYKTARVIAPEDVIRQGYARRFFVISDRYCPASVQLHDQSQNQSLAMKGSLDGSLATIDLSNASDSITSTLLWSVFPARFMRIMEGVLPNHDLIDGKEFYMQSAATMGNSMTFWLESHLFLGISQAAVEFYNRMTGEGDDTISVYGDDIIVPTGASQTVIEWLQACGFTVNAGKSYCDSSTRYRESCGEEYWDGVNVASVYYPRFPIEGELNGKLSPRVHRDGFTGVVIDNLAALVDLQHKMFTLCDAAARLIHELVVEFEPRMTTSTPDQGLSDLWSYTEQSKMLYAPMTKAKRKEIDESDPNFQRPAHLTPVNTVKKVPEDKRSSDDALLLDLFKYQEFLRHGPKFSSPLDELLGVSDPPLSYEEAHTSFEVKWVYVK